MSSRLSLRSFFVARAQHARALRLVSAEAKPPQVRRAGADCSIVAIARNNVKSAASALLSAMRAQHNVTVFKKGLTAKSEFPISARSMAEPRIAANVSAGKRANDRTSHQLRGGVVRVWSFFLSPLLGSVCDLEFEFGLSFEFEFGLSFAGRGSPVGRGLDWLDLGCWDLGRGFSGPCF
jgi:hypothetical protein